MWKMRVGLKLFLSPLYQKFVLFLKAFTIKKISEKKCIQFTEQDGTEYALKVINGTRVAFEVSRNNIISFSKEGEWK